MLKLINPTAFQFIDETTNKVINDLDQLSMLRLEILEADAIDEIITVYCVADGGRGELEGHLHIKANDVQLLDSEKEHLSLEYLTKICREYWQGTDK